MLTAFTNGLALEGGLDGPETVGFIEVLAPMFITPPLLVGLFVWAEYFD
jgi:hypothetical protein